MDFTSAQTAQRFLKMQKWDATTCRQIQRGKRIMSARGSQVNIVNLVKRDKHCLGAHWQALSVSQNVEVSWKLYYLSSPLLLVPKMERREKIELHEKKEKGLGPNHCNKSDVWDVTQWLAQYITLKTRARVHACTHSLCGALKSWMPVG